jgi:hypothetical protein
MPAPNLDYNEFAVVPKDKLIGWYFALSHIRNIAELQIQEWDRVKVGTEYTKEQLADVDDLIMFLSMTKDLLIYGPGALAKLTADADVQEVEVVS